MRRRDLLKLPALALVPFPSSEPRGRVSGEWFYAPLTDTVWRRWNGGVFRWARECWRGDRVAERLLAMTTQAGSGATAVMCGSEDWWCEIVGGSPAETFLASHAAVEPPSVVMEEPRRGDTYSWIVPRQGIDGPG